MATLTKAPAAIIPGDMWTYRDVPVQSLRAPEPTKDMFGQDMLRIWVAGDGREGYVIYGPKAAVTVQCGHDWPERTLDDTATEFTCSQCGEVVAYW